MTQANCTTLARGREGEAQGPHSAQCTDRGEPASRWRRSRLVLVLCRVVVLWQERPNLLRCPEYPAVVGRLLLPFPYFVAPDFARHPVDFGLDVQYPPVAVRRPSRSRHRSPDAEPRQLLHDLEQLDAVFRGHGVPRSLARFSVGELALSDEAGVRPPFLSRPALPWLAAALRPTSSDRCQSARQLRRIQLDRDRELPQLKAKFGGRAGENRGATTTMADADAKLLANVQDQMSRLLSQLKDLDELRDELDDEKYEETKADTLEQLKEFEKSLRTMSAGKTTLMSDLGRVSASAATEFSPIASCSRARAPPNAFSSILPICFL